MTDSNARPAPELGWGILGTGYIADLFAADLPATAQGRVRAVASRDADRAATFAAQHDIATAYKSYEALLADPDVATIICGNQVDIASRVRIWGSEGSVELTNPWQPATFRGPGRLLVHANGTQDPEVRVIDTERPLYALETDAFAHVVRTGEIPAPVMSPEDSLGNMRVLDSWRRAIGLTFDQDQADVK